MKEIVSGFCVPREKVRPGALLKDLCPHSAQAVFRATSRTAEILVCRTVFPALKDKGDILGYNQGGTARIIMPRPCEAHRNGAFVLPYTDRRMPRKKIVKLKIYGGICL